MCKRSLRVESHNVLDPRLAVALELGAVVVTPNNRLARDLVSRFDEAQRARGLRAWPSASALPWSAWLRSLWLAALTQPAAGAPRALFDSVAALHLWQDIIAASHSDLLDTRGAARQAADAWSLFQAWRLPGESLQAWRRANPLDDAGTFARWAERYQGKLHALNMLDAAQLSDALIGVAGSLERGSIVLHGFIELAPAQRRLIDALLQEGWSITSSTVPPQAVSKRVRMQFTTPQDELQGALSWARQIAVADPRARVGIVLADLDSRRDEAIALSDEILAPECLLEGGTALARPYGVSLGAPLAGQGIVATALTLIEIGSGRVAAAQAAALLRSPYLPDAGARWLARSDVERTWREQGRHDVHFNDIVGTLRKPDAALATRWQAVRPLTRTARSPRDWAQAWTDWLRALGWPGDRVLGSAEWQARDAFSDALLKFVGLHDVAPQLDAGAATEALRAIVAEQVFQPKTPAARIQILGVLEAAGLQFDALWLGGFSSERWPASPAPNPFLPLAWQRERDVPRSHPGRELDYAQRLTAGFASAAGEVVASFARVAREAEQTLSPLFARWPEGRSRDEAPHSRIADIVAKATRSVAWRDDQAPPMPPGTDVRGGSRLVESQSACPFQAFARLRLKAEAWPSPDEGLSPFERGNLLHSAMQVLWDALHDKASLVRLSPDELDVRIDAAIGAAIAKLPQARWRSLAPQIAANERPRMAGCMRAWLECERQRPDFQVHATEAGSALVLGGLRLTLRIDRMDTLNDGSTAIIDYKSGLGQKPARWFCDRPEGTQIGLYALAARAAMPTRPVRAVAYAQLKAGEVSAVGLAADEHAWPALKTPHDAPGVPDLPWGALQSHWAELLDRIAQDFREGRAQVAPRNRQACGRCDLQSLCRIRELGEEAVPHPGLDPENE